MRLRITRDMAIAALVIGLLSISGAAFAWYGGGPVWGWDGVPSLNDAPAPPPEMQKALDETAPLRKEIHSKWFDYREAVRKGDQKQAEALNAEIQKLRAELTEKLGMQPGTDGHGMMHQRMMAEQGEGNTCPKHQHHEGMDGGPGMMMAPYGMNEQQGGGMNGCPKHQHRENRAAGCGGGCNAQQYTCGSCNMAAPRCGGDNGCGGPGYGATRGDCGYEAPRCGCGR